MSQCNKILVTSLFRNVVTKRKSKNKNHIVRNYQNIDPELEKWFGFKSAYYPCRGHNMGVLAPTQCKTSLNCSS